MTDESSEIMKCTVSNAFKGVVGMRIMEWWVSARHDVIQASTIKRQSTFWDICSNF